MMKTPQAKQWLKDINVRHNEIIELENSIQELHDIFMYVAMLTENQACHFSAQL